MRISTRMIYDTSVSSMNRQQSEFMKVGQQIASGKRVVNPSDDPQAAAQAIGISQSISITEQFTESRVSARNSLSQVDSVLGSVSDGIAAAKTLVIQGVNGTLSNSDRYSVATELKGVFETLLGQANAADGSGRFLFGGSRDNSAPFVDDGSGNVAYIGDTINRNQRVDASRLMPVSDAGMEVFGQIQAGSGYVAVARVDDPTVPVTGNTGTVTFKGPGVVNPSDPDFGDAFSIAFVDVAGEINVQIDGNDTPYVPGETIIHNGLSVELTGEPVVGDSIEVMPAENGNTDIFRTLRKALDALETPLETDTQKAAFANSMSTVMRELDNSLDNVLTVRASVGGRLNELDVIDGVAESRTLGYTTNLSQLVDLDYNTAVAEYSLRQVGLQAAQKTFVDINGMSLFDFLR